MTTIIGALALIVTYIALDQGNKEGGIAAQATSITWTSFNEGFALAKQQNKELLVDIYTDWCTWCKKMDADVYTDPEVVKLLQAKYVAVKLNAESSQNITYDGKLYTEAQFAGAIGVTGYPSTLFLQSDAKPITLLPGYVPADRLADILRYIGEDHYKTVSFQDYLSKSKASH